ncbi:uncharacterized protein LOC119362440 isoform X1 [Triticum dicoccoides]|uniref:uncharacterized protein LOC119362440 isoform X1 n=1 Tax=Triticum dicoccoides TaxID=85692 RepID=UPI00188F4CDB|nr:uncharacterized protein LOC119362440 isoform X1 [Triticum dicoccoides]XP_044456893.1 uncharacterized protein LOC123188721 isoform X1 [Triticum aestivum]
MNQAPLSARPWRQNRARVRAAVSPVTGGCFAFVDRLRCCCCSYGLPVTRPACAGAAWAPSSRPPRRLQHRLERSSSVLPSRLLEQGSQREGSQHMEHNWNAPPWSSLPPATSLSASCSSVSSTPSWPPSISWWCLLGRR